ncbi:distal membrane-arm assembly complex protein 2 [Discoglossus pictus]
MAAPRVLQRLGVLPRLCPGVSHLSLTSSLPTPPPSPSDSRLRHRILHYLYTQFYDIETMVHWSVRFKQWNLRRKNAHYLHTERLYGRYVAAGYYALAQRGGVRFQGHEDWYRANKKGKFSWDFLEHRDVPVEAIDLSRSPLNFRGMDNIVVLKELRELYLSECPHIDDWALSRLHVFKDSLEVLSLAGCPQVTERGLATLHHLKNLKLLDVSSLPSVDNKGLVRILLEEVLPTCEIVGMDYTDGLEAREAGPPPASDPVPR